MKRLLYLFTFLIALNGYTQFEKDQNVIISEKQTDDTYLAGSEVHIDATIDGDAIIAGGTIVIRDTISQDLLVAGGDITIKGFVQDDIRAAGGNLIIDSTVGDDVVIFGGEVHITDAAEIRGNLIIFSGTITIDGTINGLIKAYGGDLKINGNILQTAELYAGDLTINGEITGATKMVAEDIEIGNQAKFFGDVEYWSESGTVDFKKSLVKTSATYNENIARKQHDFPWQFFGIAAIGVWIFYLLSAFLIILIINAIFRKFLSKTISFLDDNIIKALGYGLIYLLGVPFLIAFCFITLIGIPIGLLLTSFYLFSILVGHLVVALLIAFYINKKNKDSWGFWSLSFISLGFAILLRLITFIPILGGIIGILIIAVAYGLIGIVIIKNRRNLNFVES